MNYIFIQIRTKRQIQVNFVKNILLHQPTAMALNVCRQRRWEWSNRVVCCADIVLFDSEKGGACSLVTNGGLAVIGKPESWNRCNINLLRTTLYGFKQMDEERIDAIPIQASEFSAFVVLLMMIWNYFLDLTSR